MNPKSIKEPILLFFLKFFVFTRANKFRFYKNLVEISVFASKSNGFAWQSKKRKIYKAVGYFANARKFYGLPRRFCELSRNDNSGRFCVLHENHKI